MCIVAGSPKKLLVAISILAIITMCIIPTEARSVEHKKRHDRNHRGIPRTTKDTSRRHNRRTDNMLLTKESMRKPKNHKAESYTTEFNKIMRKVRNTNSHYKIDWERLKPDLQPFKEVSMPSWLPTVNFVDVHYHNYRRGRRNDTSSIPERKVSTYHSISPRIDLSDEFIVVHNLYYSCRDRSEHVFKERFRWIQ